MTYVISTLTDKSILMASDSRLNYHKEETDNSTGERFQVIEATAVCIRKTFIIDPFNIGIQFMGIGYFPENDQRYPISHFIPQLSYSIIENDSLAEKFQKIYTNLKKLTKKGDTDQFVKGIMTGYEGKAPYISTFNTYVDEFKVTLFDVGVYAESQTCNEKRPQERDSAIKYINAKINTVSQNRPHDVGGQIEILEIRPDNSYSWLQENRTIFNDTLTELLDKLNNEPNTISGKILNPPVRQKLEI